MGTTGIAAYPALAVAPDSPGELKCQGGSGLRHPPAVSERAADGSAEKTAVAVSEATLLP